MTTPAYRFALIVCIAFTLSHSAAARRLVRPTSSMDRVKQVQAVVTGRVVGLMNQDSTVQGVTYRVAIVRVGDSLKGTKIPSTIRVGFVPQPNARKVPIPVRPGFIRPVNLTVGDFGLFYLNKHAKADFYVISNSYNDFVSSAETDYRSLLTETKTLLKIGKNLNKALTSKDANDRYFAAALLIQKYRTPTGKVRKLVDIDAKESTLILKGLLEGDWNQPRGRFSQMHPWNMFNRLGLSTNDGWRPPPGAQRIEDYYIAAQAWLRENSGKYRIKKYGK